VKILFYNHTGKVSGGERVLLMILAKLDRNRFDQVVLCPADGPLIGIMKDLGVRTMGIDPLAARFTLRPDRLLRYLESFVRVVRDVRATVRREAPDVVHANSIRGGLVISAATVGLGVPVIWHAHDLLPRHPLSTAIRLFACASRRNLIVAVSQAVADRFRGRLLRWFRNRVPVKTIHNAVDLDRFGSNRKSRLALRRSLGFAETQTLVGTVGQLTPRKGQLELIRAFAAVGQDVPNVRLLIVGEAIFNRDEEYAKSLARVAESLGIADRVQFLGQREDVPALMRALDLLVVNSRAEPFGLTVVEAMASGTPVLATAVDGIGEIVEHGKSGWLVESGDHTALVEGLLTLVRDSDLRGRLSVDALSEVRARFSAGRLVSDIQSLYRSVVESGKKPHSEGARALEVKLDAD
jgi:glycosyltransferase involved in cell wall biosynthesis